MVLCHFGVIAIIRGFNSNTLTTRSGSQIISVQNLVPVGQNYLKAEESHMCNLDTTRLFILIDLSIVTVLLQLKYSQLYFSKILEFF